MPPMRPLLLQFEELDSTSLYARRLVSAAQPLALQAHLIVASVQTGGIGRHGRPWHSPLGGLWMTLLLPQPARMPVMLALQVGLAVRGIAQRALGPATPVQCKWPNDIMADNRKLGGILIETASAADGLPWLVIGIGLNVNNTSQQLAAEVRASACSMVEFAGEQVDLAILTQRLLAALLATLRTPADDAAAVGAFESVMWGLSNEAGVATNVTLPDGSRTFGTLLGIDAAGALRLGQADGTERTITSVSAYERA